jgi:hypothetical protein
VRVIYHILTSCALLLFYFQLAAERYCRYWDKRVRTFGPVKAFQPLTLHQALKDDTSALSVGFVNVLGTNDPWGRAILFMDPSKQNRDLYTRESMVRAVWYCLHVALQQDAAAQKHGIVILSYGSKAKFAQFDRGLMSQVMSAIRGCLPVRLAGIHICHPPKFIEVILPVVKLMMGDRLRKRVRIHTGSTMEVLQKLADPFQLQPHMLPTELGGDIPIDVQNWFAKRKEIENHPDATNLTLTLNALALSDDTTTKPTVDTTVDSTSTETTPTEEATTPDSEPNNKLEE